MVGALSAWSLRLACGMGALVLVALTTTGRVHASSHRWSPVTMRVSVGYGGRYRSGPAWTPVRVSLRNRGAADIKAIVDLPDGTIPGPNGSESVAMHYSLSVTLPAGTTKRVTLYMPGADIQGPVQVVVRAPRGILATATGDPVSFDDRDLSVGVLTADPADAAWLRRTAPSGTRIRMVMLSPDTFDPVPYALASLDMIVLSNTAISALDRAQLLALDRYVRNGGSLLEVGGPNWQETLAGLPGDLVPGRLTGTRLFSDLRGIGPLGAGLPPRRPLTVSVLSHPRGTMLAGQSGVPLIVRQTLGNGRIMYLAFDPALSPLQRWSGSSRLLAPVVRSAAALAMNRLGLPPAYSSPSFLNPGEGSLDSASELANIPSAEVPSLIFFIILAVAYVVILGPVNYLVLRRLHRPSMSWLTVPALALGCTACTVALSGYFRRSTVVLNVVSVVELDGHDSTLYPANRYIGMFTPAHGTYHLTYGAPALVAPIAANSLLGASPEPSSWRVEQGVQTGIDFLSMPTWSTRSIALRTSIALPGRLVADLQLDRAGDIVGTVRNDTAVHLVRPALLAGTAFQRLPDLAPGQSTRVKLRPAYTGAGAARQMLPRIYGRVPGSGSLLAQTISGMVASLPGSSVGTFSYSNTGWTTSTWSGSSGAISVSVVASSGGCCLSAPPPPERSLDDRIRNAANMVPESRDLSVLGEISLVGWTEDPLGSFSVDGSTPRRRELTLIIDPASVRLPAGPFRLRSGTLGAQLVDESPQQVASVDQTTVQPVFLGARGSATFQFSIPGGRRVHFRQLTLALYGGATGTLSGLGQIDNGLVRVFDWHAARWVAPHASDEDVLHLTRPDRYVSSNGIVLVKIDAGSPDGTVLIPDPHRDLQLLGEGIVR
jgi:hypothetical protein